MLNKKAQQAKYIIGAAYTLLFLLLVIWLPERGHGGDLGHWERWSQFMLSEGLANVYNYGLGVETEFPCNYPPIILYFYNIFAFIFNDAEAITEYAMYFKVIPLIFDFIGAMLVFLLLRPFTKYWWIPLLLLLNPAYLYNSYLWGQMDSILTVFIAASLLFAIRKQAYWATFFFGLAIHTKFQAVVFIPVFCLAMIPLIRSWRLLLNLLLLGAATLILPLLPFLLSGTIDQWYTVMSGLVDQYRNVSLNAFNFWQFVHEGQDALYAKDYQPFWWGINYKTWGLALFFISSFFALLPLAFGVLKHLIRRDQAIQQLDKLVLLSAVLCILCFFFFNTQMHERYAHPALLLSFLYGVVRKDYLIFLLTAIAYFLNMEAILHFFGWDYGSFLFQKDFVAALFLGAMIYGFFRLYKDHRKVFTANLQPK